MLLYSGPHTSLRQGGRERKKERRGEEREGGKSHRNQYGPLLWISAFPFVVTSRITYRSFCSVLWYLAAFYFPAPFDVTSGHSYLWPVRREHAIQRGSSCFPQTPSLRAPEGPQRVATPLPPSESIAHV